MATERSYDRSEFKRQRGKFPAYIWRIKTSNFVVESINLCLFYNIELPESCFCKLVLVDVPNPFFFLK